MPGESMGVGVNCQGNAGNAEECRGTYGSGCIVPGECRGTTRGMQRNGCKVLAELRGMQENARGTYESGGKVPA